MSHAVLIKYVIGVTVSGVTLENVTRLTDLVTPLTMQTIIGKYLSFYRCKENAFFLHFVFI